MKNTRFTILRLFLATFVFSVVIFGLFFLTPSEVKAEFSLIGSSNTVAANGIAKDRHMVVFDKYIVNVYLDMYRTSGDGGADPEAGKGYLRFRKTGDGFTWTEALTNPQDVISGNHFFLGADMVGDKTCADPTDCNLYLIYFRNNSSYSSGCNKNLYGGGDVFFRELRFDQETEQWTLQPELQITNENGAVWWDTYASWLNGVGDGRFCNSYLSGPVFAAEPKPQIWVEDNRALIMYDIQTEHGMRSAAFPACPAPPYDPTTCFDGVDYTYLRIKTMTRSGSGMWSIDANSARDAAYFPNCVNGDPVSGSSPSGFIYAAITKNPVTDRFAIIYNRTALGTCARVSSWAPAPVIAGTAPLGYVFEDAGSSLEWLCAHDTDDEFTNGTTCTQGQLENVNPGPNFSVVSHDSTNTLQQAIRVVYPFDNVGTQHVAMKEYHAVNDTPVFNWDPSYTNITNLAGFGNQLEIVPVIGHEGDDYWVAAHKDTAGGLVDYTIRYRRMRWSTPDPNDDSTWQHVAIYPDSTYGEIDNNGTVDDDRYPTIPHDLLPGYLTTVGHPSLAWVSGTTPTSVYFPEDVTGVRVYGWAWSPIVGWISLDYLNTGTLSSQRYGIYIDKINNALKGEMWSPNFGWITSLRRVCSNNSRLACNVDADCPGGASWVNTGDIANADTIEDLIQTSSGEIFAATTNIGGAGPGGDVFKSSDGGVTWTSTDTTNAFDVSNGVLSLLETQNGTILAGTNQTSQDHIYKYDPLSNSWSSAANLNLPGYWPSRMYDMVQVPDGTIFAGSCCDGDIFKSSDDGNTWQHEVQLTGVGGDEVRAMTVSDEGYVYAGTSPNGNVYVHEYNGGPWTDVGDMPGTVISEALMPGPGGLIYAGDTHFTGADVYRLETDNTTWTQTGILPSGTDVMSLLRTPDETLFAGVGQPEAIYQYDRDRDTWITAGFPNVGGYVYSMLIGDDGMFYAGNNDTATDGTANIYKKSFCLEGAGTPPVEDNVSPPYLAQHDSENNRIEGWARIMSMKKEGDALDWRDGGQRWLPVENVSQTDYAGGGRRDEIELTVDTEGIPHVVWSNFDADSDNYDIYYLRRENDTWITADGSEYEPGVTDPHTSGLNISQSTTDSRRPSLDVDSSGNPHIAWGENAGDYWGGTVWYGYWNSSTGTWQTEQIDNGGGPSLKLDRNNQPHIAYRSGNDAFADIIFRKKTSSWVSITGDLNNLNVSETPGFNQRSWLPSLQLSNDPNQYPHVVWAEDVGGRQIYYRYWNGLNWVTASGDATQGSTANDVSVNADITDLPEIGLVDGMDPRLDLYSDNRPGVVWRDPGIVLYRQWKNGDWVDANPDDGLNDDTILNDPRAGETWRVVHASESMAIHIDSSDRPHIVWSDDIMWDPQIGDVQYRYWDKFIDGGNGDWVTASGDYEDNGIAPLLNYDDANLNVSQTPGIYSRTVAFDIDQSGSLHIIWSDTEYNTAELMCDPTKIDPGKIWDCAVDVPGYPNCEYYGWGAAAEFYCATSDVFYRSWFPGRNWGWIRFNGTWDRTGTSTSLRHQLNAGETLARVLSTVGFPYDSSLRVSPGTGIQEDIPYGNITEDTITLSSAASNTHPTSSAVRLTDTIGTYEVGAQYLEDKAAFQLFDFGYSPQIGWIEFRPFRFIGFPYLTTEAGDIYSADNIEIPAPPAPTGEFTSTYLIQADGTIEPFLTYGIRSVPGATSMGGYDCSVDPCAPVEGSTSFLEEGVGDFGYPGISEGYENILGKLDVESLTTIVSDCQQFVCTGFGGGDDGDLCSIDSNCDGVCGEARVDCADINGTGADINSSACVNQSGLMCENDGRGKNAFGGWVEIRHATAGFGNAVPFDFAPSTWVDLDGDGTTNDGYEWFIPVELEGKVYYYPNGSVYLQNNFVIENGAGGASGAGMIIAKDARIRGAASKTRFDGIVYDLDTPGSVSEMASFIMVSLEDIEINPDIEELAGSYITLGNSPTGVIDTCINVGSAASCSDFQLKIRGLMMAREFRFNRTYGVVNDVLEESSEVIINDGRLLANPPLGLQDLSKSLPRFNQVRPK
ncbi:hypothetical protein ACFL0L_03250 [Patescibacteria group bacterium]